MNSYSIDTITRTELERHDGIIIIENQCGVITPDVNHQIDLHLTDGSSKPDRQNGNNEIRHGDPDSTAKIDTAVNHPQIIDTCEQYSTNTNSKHDKQYVTDGNSYVESEVIPVITHQILNKKCRIYEPGNSKDNSDNSISNTMSNEQNLTDESVNLPTELHEQRNIDNELNKEMCLI